jgi:hypothetical protein
MAKQEQKRKQQKSNVNREQRKLRIQQVFFASPGSINHPVVHHHRDCYNLAN